MLTTLFIAFVSGGALVTLLNWRLGVFLAIFIGMVQDPVRKMTAGTPPLFVLSSLPIWALVWIAVLVRERDAWYRFRKADPRRARAMWLFAFCLIPGTAVTLSYGLGAAPVAALGLFAYVAPLLTLVAGFTFPRRTLDVQRILAFYAIVSSVTLTGTFLEYANVTPDWAALGTEALGGQWLRYPVAGGVIKLIAGFFRSPDLAAWHAAALVMIAFTMSLLRGGLHTKSWLLLVAWGGACLVVAGRRKGIIMPLVWAAVMAAVFLRTKRARLFGRLAFLGAVAGAAFAYASGEFGISDDYFGYAQTAVSAAPQRLVEGSWDSVWYTFLQSGWLGSGIGSATQGSHHLGIRVAQTWQESGPSKLMVELGVPGVIGATLLLVAIVRSALGASRQAGSHSVLPLQVGLLAFSTASGLCFIVSHQIYSDLTVLNLSGFLLGAALSAPHWAGVRQLTVQHSVPQPLSARNRIAITREVR
jgi:hypothetical protein